MNIFYNDVDITASVHLVSLRLTDYAGGKPDSITVVFSDTENLWSKWNPQKNDRLRVKKDGFDTGVMYIDHIGQSAGKFEIKALSIPQESKTARTQAWEDVRLLEIATEIAVRYGLKLKTYNITNHYYSRVDQLEDSDFAFLTYRCMLEGYALKIYNQTLVIYDERTEEQRQVDVNKATVRKSDIIGDFKFSNHSIDIYKKCIIQGYKDSKFIQCEFTDDSIEGPTLIQKISSDNLEVANRWAKGILRSFNKYMITGTFAIELNMGFSAGTNINVIDIGFFDGRYFIDRIIHDLVTSRSILTIRKPLIGY